jgi:hypothetical protein
MPNFQTRPRAPPAHSRHHRHNPNIGIIGERYGEVGGEAQDHVFVAGESSDQSAGLGGEGAGLGVVVGAALGERTPVVVADLGQDSRVEVVATGGAGVVGGLVGLQQGAGQGGGPEWGERVGVGQSAQISQEMGFIPMSG